MVYVDKIHTVKGTLVRENIYYKNSLVGNNIYYKK